MPTKKGYKQDPEWVKKRIASRLATLRIKGFPRVKHTAENRKKQSEYLKNKLATDPIHKANLLAACKRKRKPLLEYRRKQISECFKGKKLSDEHKKKLSIVRARNHKENPNYGMRGKPHPMRGKRSPNTAGKNHYNWKGGKTKENHKIYISPEYNEWRRKIFKCDGYRCKDCGVNSPGLQAHHILPVQYFPEFIYELWNGVILCRFHHGRIHNLYRQYNLFTLVEKSRGKK